MDALLRDLPPAGPLAQQMGCLVARNLANRGDIPPALDMLERLPRGAFTWSVCRLNDLQPADLAVPRLRRIWEENRPPWAR